MGEVSARLATVLDLLILALPEWIVGVVLLGAFDREWIAEHHVADECRSECFCRVVDIYLNLYFDIWK